MKHRALFMGKRVREKYQCVPGLPPSPSMYIYSSHSSDYSIDPYVVNGTEVIETLKFHEDTIDSPVLEEGRSVYIEALNIEVKVIRAVRIAEGGYVYHTDHVIEAVVDEITAKSKIESEEKCETEIKHYREVREKYEKEYYLKEKKSGGWFK